MDSVNEVSSNQNELASQIKVYLEPYKQIIPKLHAFFTWKKQYYPLLIFSCTTFIYILIWILDVSILSTLSICGIFVTILDFFLPGLISNFTDSLKWSEKEESQYEQLCNEAASYISKVKLCLTSWYEMRQSKSKIYYLSVLGVLFFTVWTGDKFNNLLFAYLVTLVILLFPGLKYNEICKKALGKVFTYIKNHFKNKEKKN